VGVTLEQQAIGTDKMHRVAQSNTRDDGVPSSRPSQLPRRKRAANPRTRLEPGVLPKKVTSGATVVLSDSQVQCSIDVSDRAAGSASALIPEPPSENILEDEPYDITMASENPSIVYVEKEPEAAVFPKQPLLVTPPIWAEVGQVGYDYPNHVGNMVSSHDRKCASPLTTSGAITAVFIM
jgi:hypothetical protein